MRIERERDRGLGRIDGKEGDILDRCARIFVTKTRGGTDRCFPADVSTTEVRLPHSLPERVARCRVGTSDGVWNLSR
jgi:hypothetical protein